MALMKASYTCWSRANGLAKIISGAHSDVMSFESYRHLQPEPILNAQLPAEVIAMAARQGLPGIGPLPVSDWLVRSAVFDMQMALRDVLIRDHRERVVIENDQPSAAAQELYDLVLQTLRQDPGYDVTNAWITRPDGVRVDLDADTPIGTLGRLLQEDLLILQSGPNGHLLTEGVLCFPSGWTLAEKTGRTLGRIHLPVADYTVDIEQRVQRLFDAVRPGKILARANNIHHDNYHLFQPYSESDPRDDTANPAYLRAERQCILKLPRSGAAIFSIHSYVVRQNANKAL